jgi:hypothetical protein
MSGQAVERAGPDRDIDALRREIENLVTEFDLDLQVRIFAQEGGQSGQNAGPGEGGGRGDAHAAPALCTRNFADRRSYSV